MIAFHATAELRATFEKLIKTMDVPVQWNGMFVVLDNTLILQGEVRSLFFHFDSRKVFTNIIDLNIPVQVMVPIEKNEYVRNAVNMLLYAFGKWGAINGLKVEKDYDQLSQLFKNILGEFDVEIEYNRDHFWFFQKGVKIIYEDVIQCALDFKGDEPEEEKEAEAGGGLWHKLIWKQRFADFTVTEISARERNRNRLGNNYYGCGYLCPDCQNRMHSVVYPVGKEFVIETEEGGVRIARAYTCNRCALFYTPRPRRLLMDGDCYQMDFAGDRGAYEDYRELLGKDGAKVCNYNYNEYVNRKNTPVTEYAAKQEWEENIAEIDELPQREFERFFAKTAEGFYPEESVEKMEKVLWKKRKERQKEEWRPAGGRTSLREENTGTGYEAKDEKKKEKVTNEEKQEQEYQEKISRYQARIQLFSRLSDRQRKELFKQIEADTVVSASEKKELLQTLENLTGEERYETFTAKIAEAKNKNALVMFRVYGEIRQADLPQEKREKLLKMTGVTPEVYEAYQKERQESSPQKTGKDVTQKAGEVVRKDGRTRNSSYRAEPASRGTYVMQEKKTGRMHPVITETVPEVKKVVVKNAGKKSVEGFSLKDWLKNKKRKSMNRLQNRIAKKEAKLSVPEFAAKFQEADKDDRKALQQLLEHLYENKDFEPSIVESYEEQIKEQMRRLDENYLDGLMGNLFAMTSEEGVSAFEKIAGADLLPELKTDALKQLKRHIKKLKSRECELLVQKLKKQMAEAGIDEPERHHYNPAERIYKKEATAEEVEVMEFAMASYGAKRGYFEYPILTVDTSWNKSGEKGMFLTPEHLYYSTLMTAYRIPVSSIERLEGLTGLLNKGLYVYQKNGEKTKLPYAVDTAELPKLAEVLDGFMKYLQEKPFSRKEAYLVKGDHEEVCCFRCGYVYRGGEVCPKCGYKANE